MKPLVLRADARALPLPDASVDLICTSPPYYALRSYTDGGQHYHGQIGSEPTPADYIAALVDCTREMVRVLKPGGSIFVDLGDKYVGGGMGGHSAGLVGTRPQGEGNSYRRQRVDLPSKSLIGLPWRYALACVDRLGLILRAEVIWSKPNGLPESVTDRVRRSHEQWFHLVKQPRYYSAVDEIREPHSDNTHARRKDASLPPKNGAGLELGVRRGYFGDTTFNPLGKLPGSVWTIPTEPLSVPAHLGVDHFAAFPTEWPRRIILGWSPSGVCTVCGEGRRPVVRQINDAYRAARAAVKPTTARDVALYSGGRSNSRRSSDINNGVVRPEYVTIGYVCDCSQPVVTGLGLTAPGATRASAPGAPTRPAVVLDPFGGTGTTALVAHALGRIGISVDRSADYNRIATWRTTNPGEIAKAMRVPKPEPIHDDQMALDLEGVW